MEVNCVFFTPAQDAVGQSVSVALDEGVTVADAFDALLASYEGLEPSVDTSEEGERIGRRLNVTVDRTNVRQLDGPDTALEDGAVLRVAPSVVGGAR